jgi:hypothetical protein
MSDFRDCVVSLIDLNNVGRILSRRSKKGVRIMRRLHRLVNRRAHTLTAHEEVCFWQDSVLLLAFVDGTPGSFCRAMDDVGHLKEAIEGLHPCHAVCVKGQAFPAPPTRSRNTNPRVIYLSASSLAFSNCFKIESELKRLRADWYIDPRIATRINTRKADHLVPVELFPRKTSRRIRVFHDSFFDRPQILRYPLL